MKPNERKIIVESESGELRWCYPSEMVKGDTDFHAMRDISVLDIKSYIYVNYCGSDANLKRRREFIDGIERLEQNIRDKTHIQNELSKIQQEKTMKHPHADLIMMHARQVADGESHYWTWSYNGEQTFYPIFLTESGTYHCKPSPHHPNYAVYKEWEAHGESGAVDRGEVELQGSFNGTHWRKLVGLGLEFEEPPARYYRIVKTDKHPDNQKKVLDWTQEGLLGCYVSMGNIGGGVLVYFSAGYVFVRQFGIMAEPYAKTLKIIKPPENKGWQVYMEGITKVPEGVEIEWGYEQAMVGSQASHIPTFKFKKTRYRVTGIADGWIYPKD